MLSDDILLHIFDSYRREWILNLVRLGMWPWRALVHVCRRWRRIAFGCPHYLKLYPSCEAKTDVHAALDIWQALPLSIFARLNEKYAYDNIISALEHRDRFAVIYLLELNHYEIERCIALMQEPFPVLRSLHLMADQQKKLVINIPGTFLGGSAPLPQSIRLCGFRFPGLPKLLASTSDLVYLNLRDFPMTGKGHISPDAMTTCLSVLTTLRSLTLILTSSFRLRGSPYPTDQRPPSSAHTVLPALTHLFLQGPHGYLEDFVARVDTPLLNGASLTFTDEPTFDDPRVPQFIRRTKVFHLLDGVELSFHRERVFAYVHSSIGPADVYLSSQRSGLPAQVAIAEQIFAQWPPLVSHVQLLTLDDYYHSFEEETLGETAKPWLGLLRRFSVVHTLRLLERPTMFHLAHILRDLEGERATEVLPALRTIELIYSPRYPSEALDLLRPFLAAREEWGQPVVINVGYTF